MSDAEARADLRSKIVLERDLQDSLRKFNKQLVRNTIKAEGNADATFTAETMNPELEEMLRDHYSKAGNEFDSQISDTLPEDIATSPAEEAIILATLANYFDDRAPAQSAIITDTNQRDMDASVAQANTIAAEQALEGTPPTIQGTAVVSGAILSRKLNARVAGIANMETQAPAEVAKATEAQVLVFQEPTIVTGTPKASGVRKEWVTAGDERVRPEHSIADSQFRDMNDNFIVGGEALAFPGDMDHGATIGNTINCRCDSVISREDVFAIRRRRNEQPSIDQTATEQILISIGN